MTIEVVEQQLAETRQVLLEIQELDLSSQANKGSSAEEIRLMWLKVSALSVEEI